MLTSLPQINELMAQVLIDINIRIKIAKASHYWFFHIYFNHYVKYPTADFQKELFAITEAEDSNIAVIVAFRGSAKSTIMTMSYPIWAILGKQQKKFIVIIGQTQNQARLHLSNLKRELESNDLLRKELGPFEEKNDEWGSTSLVIPRLNARITAASSEQSVRGLRHGEHRPDLIICDDVEDLSSVKTKEGRDKVYNWFTGEVIPAGDRNTKIIVIGNLLHEDSLLMRLKTSIEEKRLDGLFKSYPLVNALDEIMWPGKFPDLESIDREKKKIGNEISWQREYLLRIVSDHGQVVRSEWIKYYDELPAQKPRFIYTGVDLAIKQTDSADYTAMVTAKTFGCEDELRICILPNPVNEKLTFPQTIERIKAIDKAFPTGDIYIEEVGYQTAIIQQLEIENVYVYGVKVHGQDKRSRLATTTHLIQSGKILFPRKGAEDLIRQLTGFGLERHDDLADAFSILIMKLISENHTKVIIDYI